MPDVSGLATLHALTSAISSAARLDEIYDAALDALAHGLGVHRASILLFDPDGVMRFTAWRGLSDRYRKAVEGHTPWKADAQDARIIVVPDVTRDESLAPFLATIQAEGIAGMAFVPLKRVGGIVGKFMLYLEQPRDLSKEERTLAEVIASQVAFAVRRIRAEQWVREGEAELRLVTDIAPVYQIGRASCRERV